MYKIEVDSEKLKKLRADHGISAYGLARIINSSTVQMWRLESGRHTTSTGFLKRLIPVFGVQEVADLVKNPTQRMVFLAEVEEPGKSKKVS